MKNNSQRFGVRKYHKSELPRLRWTPVLHDHFVETVESLGGKHKATPKRILEMMHAKGLKISHIKSHLQMYRNMKKQPMVAPAVDHQLLEGAANHANGLKICSICTPERSRRTKSWAASNNDRSVAKPELVLLHNKGFSQTSEETDYDLNQEPESSTCLLSDLSDEEENDGEIKFLELSPISFNTPLIPTMHSAQQRMPCPSPASADDHILDSSSIQSLGTTYINLDLTI